MELINCRGLPMFLSKWVSKEQCEAAMDYQPRDGDVIVATYPKTGTTWMQYIVWQILHRGETYPSFEDANFRLMPYMEMAGLDTIEKIKPPRFYKTHFPYTHLNINPNAKYLYVYRNPGDTLVSYFYFWNDMRDTKTMKFIPLDEFFESFISGEICYGDYFDHVLSFYSHRNDENVLFISYEGLKRDTKGEILKIAKFLGDEYYRTLTEDDSLLEKVLEITSFEYMKKHLKSPKPPTDYESGKNGRPSERVSDNKEEESPTNFFRKGVVGDGISHLSEEQREKLLGKVLRKMENTELLECWKSSLISRP